MLGGGGCKNYANVVRFSKSHAGRRGDDFAGVTYARAHIPVWRMWGVGFKKIGGEEEEGVRKHKT